MSDIIIPLSRGYVAIVDAADAHLAAFKWCAHVKRGTVYAVRNVPDGTGKQRMIMLHREVLGLKPGDPLVDHRDGDGLNNRRANLRAVSKRENARNIVGPRVDNTTGYLGVYRDRKRFKASIWADGTYQYLGVHDTAEEAHAARVAAEERLWGTTPRRTEAHAACKVGGEQ